MFSEETPHHMQHRLFCYNVTHFPENHVLHKITVKNHRACGANSVGAQTPSPHCDTRGVGCWPHAGWWPIATMAGQARWAVRTAAVAGTPRVCSPGLVPAGQNRTGVSLCCAQASLSGSLAAGSQLPFPSECPRGCPAFSLSVKWKVNAQGHTRLTKFTGALFLAGT